MVAGDSRGDGAREDAVVSVGVQVEVEVDIDRPVDVVASFAGDPGNAAQWYANTDPPADLSIGGGCVRQRPAPTGVGG